MVYLNRTKRCKYVVNELYLISDLHVDQMAAIVYKDPTIKQPPLYT